MFEKIFASLNLVRNNSEASSKINLNFDEKINVDKCAKLWKSNADLICSATLTRIY